MFHEWAHLVSNWLAHGSAAVHATSLRVIFVFKIVLRDIRNNLSYISPS